MPVLFSQFTSVFKVLNFDVVKFMPLQCAFPSFNSFLMSFYATTGIPIVGTAVLLLAYFIQIAIIHLATESVWVARGGASAKVVTGQYLGFFMFCISAILPPVTAKIFQGSPHHHVTYR